MPELASLTPRTSTTGDRISQGKDTIVNSPFPMENLKSPKKMHVN